MNYQEKIKKAVEFIKNSTYTVALTGAGISTESGIPDFRSPGGLWQRFKMITFDEFIINRQARQEFWEMKKELLPELLNAKPNEAHYALTKLEKMGLLKYIITQNIDGLHQLAGSKQVIEIHGNNREALCIDCGRFYKIEEIIEFLKEDIADVRCSNCGGVIKPKIIFFGESMPEREFNLAQTASSQCHLMLVVGTSLQVYPAAGLPQLAYHSGTKLIFINQTETPMDELADVVIHEKAGKALGDILKEFNRRF